MQAVPALSDAIVLFKVWLRQRNSGRCTVCFAALEHARCDALFSAFLQCTDGALVRAFVLHLTSHFALVPNGYSRADRRYGILGYTTVCGGTDTSSWHCTVTASQSRT